MPTGNLRYVRECGIILDDTHAHQDGMLRSWHDAGVNLTLLNQRPNVAGILTHSCARVSHNESAIWNCECTIRRYTDSHCQMLQSNALSCFAIYFIQIFHFACDYNLNQIHRGRWRGSPRPSGVVRCSCKKREGTHHLVQPTPDQRTLNRRLRDRNRSAINPLTGLGGDDEYKPEAGKRVNDTLSI